VSGQTAVLIETDRQTARDLYSRNNGEMARGVQQGWPYTSE
jgi:hypothetical protein